jgi:UDP-N-acetyl-D-mannosaminuronic acid dehydrogenase
MASRLPESDARFPLDVGVIGGGGHVGLPLAMTFADCGLATLIYDTDEQKLGRLGKGEMPFFEKGGAAMLQRVRERGTLLLTHQPDRLAECRFLICIIGTPVDEHLNPSFTGIQTALEGCLPHLRDGQILVLRSTIYPGISKRIQEFLSSHGLEIAVAFCPERVAQGFSLEEFRTLPQIISAFDEAALAAVKDLFGCFAGEFVVMSPMEAELCKLMTNAWRYLQFAAVNQFYMIATEHGLNFERILHGCRYRYPRMAGMPGPGLAAGPCLVKDTMQLAAFSRNTFVLGHSAMLINEGLPAHLIQLAKRLTDLSTQTVGILGLAFKGESDDPRDSLSYKLRKLLLLESPRVLCTDPFVDDPLNLPLEDVVRAAGVFFVATPHNAYKALRLPPEKVVIDVWNCLPPRLSAEALV